MNPHTLAALFARSIGELYDTAWRLEGDPSKVRRARRILGEEKARGSVSRTPFLSQVRTNVQQQIIPRGRGEPRESRVVRKPINPIERISKGPLLARRMEGRDTHIGRNARSFGRDHPSRRREDGENSGGGWA